MDIGAGNGVMIGAALAFGLTALIVIAANGGAIGVSTNGLTVTVNPPQ
jgi:hypothetical protein